MPLQQVFQIAILYMDLLVQHICISLFILLSKLFEYCSNKNEVASKQNAGNASPNFRHFFISSVCIWLLGTFKFTLFSHFTRKFLILNKYKLSNFKTWGCCLHVYTILCVAGGDISCYLHFSIKNAHTETYSITFNFYLKNSPHLINLLHKIVNCIVI